MQSQAVTDRRLIFSRNESKEVRVSKLRRLFNNKHYIDEICNVLDRSMGSREYHKNVLCGEVMWAVTVFNK